MTETQPGNQVRYVRFCDLYKMDTEAIISCMKWLAIWKAEATRLDLYRDNARKARP